MSWRILKDNREGASADSAGKASTNDGTILLVTDNVYGTGGLADYGVGYNYHSGSWVQYTNTTIKSNFDSWYTANVSAELKEMTCLPNLQYEKAPVLKVRKASRMSSNTASRQKDAWNPYRNLVAGSIQGRKAIP